MSALALLVVVSERVVTISPDTFSCSTKIDGSHDYSARLRDHQDRGLLQTKHLRDSKLNQPCFSSKPGMDIARSGLNINGLKP